MAQSHQTLAEPHAHVGSLAIADLFSRPSYLAYQQPSRVGWLTRDLQTVRHKEHVNTASLKLHPAADAVKGMRKPFAKKEGTCPYTAIIRRPTASTIHLPSNTRPSTRCTAMKLESENVVIIVGGGYAGLAAAVALHKVDEDFW